MKFARPVREKRQPDVIPLINIVFLMLIFFLVSATLRPFAMRGVTLPQAATEGGLTNGQVHLFVAADGVLTLDGKPIDDTALGGQLASRRAKTSDANLSLVADRDADAAMLLRHVRTARAAGFDEVRIVTERGR